MSVDLDQAAIDLLKRNDRGGYTVPTARLYPYQWNWDSAFCALGFASFDRNRAWQELETLFEGQWDDGMLPHIIFRRDDPDYFPGPTVWQTGTTPPTSGHSQPPVLASIVKRLLDSQESNDEEQRGHTLFPKILAWHRWYHHARDPHNLGLVATMHPWETGRDNSPEWDAAMANIDVADLGDYQRRDLAHSTQDERPRSYDYDRYLTIVKFGRECGWDSNEIAARGPLWVADPGINMILLRADRDLLMLAKQFNETTAASEIETWITNSEAGIDRLWNQQVGGFCALDLRTDKHADGLSNASMLAFYAGAGTSQQQQRMNTELRRISDSVRYLMPSWPATHTAFEARRYWRGPIWAMMNFMLAQGLQESGDTELSQRLRKDTCTLIQQSGFHEYYCPLTGDGCGGDDFSWTAAIWLAWASPAQQHST